MSPFAVRLRDQRTLGDHIPTRSWVDQTGTVLTRTTCATRFAGIAVHTAGIVGIARKAAGSATTSLSTGATGSRCTDTAAAVVVATILTASAAGTAHQRRVLWRTKPILTTGRASFRATGLRTGKITLAGTSAGGVANRTGVAFVTASLFTQVACFYTNLTLAACGAVVRTTFERRYAIPIGTNFTAKTLAALKPTTATSGSRRTCDARFRRIDATVTGLGFGLDFGIWLDDRVSSPATADERRQGYKY